MRRTSKRVVRIVLTGGPVGGKTRAMRLVAKWLQGLGFIVLLVKEAATELILSNVHPGAASRHPGNFQRAIIRSIRANEGVFQFWAEELKTDMPIVILCDRGAPEIEAYVGPKMAAEVMRLEGLTLGQLFAPYDAVIHLVTAADGALEVYEREFKNNPARNPDETPERAIALDKATQGAWIGANHFAVVPNLGVSWATKFKYIQRVISRVLGIPVRREIERSWELVRGSKVVIPTKSAVAELTQVYLTTRRKKVDRRIRRRLFGDFSQFFFTEKEPVASRERKELEDEIAALQFAELLEQADPRKEPIHKMRRYFLYAGQYFELDTFISPHPGLQRLELELLTRRQPVKLPPWLPIEREVTDDPTRSNSALALRS